VVFIVAAQTKVQNATMIYFPSIKLIVMRSILHGIYDSTSKCAYVDARESNDPAKHIPKFREALVS
jgi:flagellar biosynthesis protein FliQ